VRIIAATPKTITGGKKLAAVLTVCVSCNAIRN
jgi:hypothetical protein